MTSLDSKANQVFNDFSLQAFQTQFEIYEQGARWPIWKRLTASRIFYLHFLSELYTRSRFTSFKPDCLKSKKNAIKQFGLSGDIFFTEVESFHLTILFFSATPDAILLRDNRIIVVEVKSLFEKNDQILNKIGENYERGSDIEKWKMRLLFSMHCACSSEGVLLIHDAHKDCIVDQFWVNQSMEIDLKKIEA